MPEGTRPCSSLPSESKRPSKLRWHPSLNNIDEVPGLHVLNEELAEALEADRATARAGLYNRLPAMLGLQAAGTSCKAVQLSEAILSSLTVRTQASVTLEGAVELDNDWCGVCRMSRCGRR